MTIPRLCFWPASIIAIFFVAHLPQLSLLGFFNAEEAVNVASSLELKRDGHWKLPTLSGQPRREKPPLAAWVTAGFIIEPTRALEFQARLPALLCACVVLASVYVSAKSVADRLENSEWRLESADSNLHDPPSTIHSPIQLFPVLALVFTATNLLFLRHAQLNMADTFLAATCAAAHAGWALAVFGGRWWAGMMLAGVAMGLGILSKGHMVFLHVLAPWVIFILLTRPLTRTRLLPLFFGLILMILLGSWWYVWVGVSEPGMVHFWLHEATRNKSVDLHPDPWFAYIKSTRFWLPWFPLLCVGAWVCARRRSGADLLLLLMFFLPLLVMNFFSERKDRYLLPLVPAGALLASVGALRLAGSLATRDVRRLATTIFLVVLVAHGGYWFTQSRGEKGESIMSPMARVIESHNPPQIITTHPSGDFIAVRAAAADLSIELNRTIEWHGLIPREPYVFGTVVFTVQSRNSPAIVSPGLREIARVERHNEIRIAYVVERMTSSPTR